MMTRTGMTTMGFCKYMHSPAVVVELVLCVPCRIVSLHLSVCSFSAHDVPVQKSECHGVSELGPKTILAFIMHSRSVLKNTLQNAFLVPIQYNQ